MQADASLASELLDFHLSKEFQWIICPPAQDFSGESDVVGLVFRAFFRWGKCPDFFFIFPGKGMRQMAQQVIARDEMEIQLSQVWPMICITIKLRVRLLPRS